MSFSPQTTAELVGTPFAPFLPLLRSVSLAKSSRKKIVTLVKETWNLPELRAAREQETPKTAPAQHTIELACPHIEEWDFARELVEKSIRTDDVAWETVREYLADLLESSRPIGQHTRNLLAWMMRNKRPNGKTRPDPATHHKDLQLALLVGIVHAGAGYSLSTNDTTTENAFSVVAAATEESPPSTKQAWQRKIPGESKKKALIAGMTAALQVKGRT